jgi:hypothetical protein
MKTKSPQIKELGATLWRIYYSERLCEDGFWEGKGTFGGLRLAKRQAWYAIARYILSKGYKP